MRRAFARARSCAARGGGRRRQSRPGRGLSRQSAPCRARDAASAGVAGPPPAQPAASGPSVAVPCRDLPSGESPPCSRGTRSRKPWCRRVRLETSMCSVSVPRGPAAAATKPCCLCWCCCCSCSWAKWLAARGPDGGPGRKPRELGASPSEPLLDGDAPPSLEEIRGWGESFERLMRSAAGRKVFRDFLRGEYSEENIMFWLACEELKRETDPDAVEEKARFIYEDYISILSPKEVSLDSRVREAVNRNMVEPTPHTFDEAQLQIYTLMHRDSYPRFVNSPLYKALARVPLAEDK